MDRYPQIRAQLDALLRLVQDDAQPEDYQLAGELYDVLDQLWSEAQDDSDGIGAKTVRVLAEVYREQQLQLQQKLLGYLQRQAEADPSSTAGQALQSARAELDKDRRR
jgi:hypothetical protein